MGRHIACPHCEGEISASYAVKSLAVVAKSEGQELSEELAELAGDEQAEGEETEEEVDDEEVAKGGKRGAQGMAEKVGNKKFNYKGKKPGSANLKPTRSGPGGKVTRAAGKKNPINDGMGVKKSLFPVFVGQPQLVSYTGGADAALAKSLESGTVGQESTPNHRAAAEAQEE